MRVVLFLLGLLNLMLGRKPKYEFSEPKPKVKMVNNVPIRTDPNEKGATIVPPDELKEKAKAQLNRSYKLKQFDYNKIALDSFIIVVGKRRFGKSTWTRWILSKLWQYFPGKLTTISSKR
jgi:polynucleotide 5'-kinase involved in rRNA processing